MLEHLYVHYTCPVRGIRARVFRRSRLGRAVLAGDLTTIERITGDYYRMVTLQARVAELCGPEGEALGQAAIARHAREHGRMFATADVLS